MLLFFLLKTRVEMSFLLVVVCSAGGIGVNSRRRFSRIRFEGILDGEST